MKYQEGLLAEAGDESHPVRVRGLKFDRVRETIPDVDVAPRAGAWIEIFCNARCPSYPHLGSHPVRVRGLKCSRTARRTTALRSHPVRVRGLKFRRTDSAHRTPRVAPRAGAWIEISGGAGSAPAPYRVAPRAGAWIEILPLLLWYKPQSVAPRAGAWIEIARRTRPRPLPRRRTPCGCVD